MGTVDTEKIQKYEEFKSFVTYMDIITYALALTKTEKFDANPDEWHKVLYEICRKYKDRIPELKRIYFVRSDPLPPQSEQIDHLIKVLSMSHEASMPNPRYPTIDITNDKKQIIKGREKKRLEKYSGEIQNISLLLERSIGR